VSNVTVDVGVGTLATVTREPTGGTVAHYQGPNPYRATPLFDVAYDAAMWEYVEDDSSGRQSQLKHRSLPGCAIWLRAGPVDATPVADVWLAERAWTIAQVQPNIIQYSSPEGGHQLDLRGAAARAVFWPGQQQLPGRGRGRHPDFPGHPVEERTTMKMTP
jgi:hypothetical protein